MASLWDIFCRVVDNWGDMGVCWRLAADLAARGQQVRLWADDASALAWMAPQGTPGVQVLPWPDALPPGGIGDVVVETFGCDLPEAFAAALARANHAGQRTPPWINLDYLSAEAYVQRSHGLPSPVMSGAGQGMVRWYFYPGFTERTGGLLRESDLLQRQARFDRVAWRARHGIGDAQFAISLFCYEPATLSDWLGDLAQHENARLLVTPGRASAAVHAARGGRPRPFIKDLAPCSQPEFDELLWASDFNCVRGEDSLVRALWAGRPLLWHIYPQHDNAHYAKLDAFLDWLDAPPSMRAMQHLWNGMRRGAMPDVLDARLHGQWTACVQAARQRLLAQDDLVTQLFRFVREKS